MRGKHFTVHVFENNTATCFVYATVVIGQPAGLSKEACLYADSDWLSLSVSHRVARSQLAAAAVLSTLRHMPTRFVLFSLHNSVVALFFCLFVVFCLFSNEVSTFCECGFVWVCVFVCVRSIN